MQKNPKVFGLDPGVLLNAVGIDLWKKDIVNMSTSKNKPKYLCT